MADGWSRAGKLHALGRLVSALGEHPQDGRVADGEGPMQEVTLDTLGAVGGALGHTGRLRVLALLRESDLYVCQIRTVLGLAASTVSVHLAILRRAGLVAEQKQGRFVQYGLTDQEPLGSLVREILHLVKDDCRVLDDARLLESVRRVPLDRLCRGGLSVTATGIPRAGMPAAAAIPKARPGASLRSCDVSAVPSRHSTGPRPFREHLRRAHPSRTAGRGVRSASAPRTLGGGARQLRRSGVLHPECHAAARR